MAKLSIVLDSENLVNYYTKIIGHMEGWISRKLVNIPKCET